MSLLSYQQWDVIADSYIPVLLVVICLRLLQLVFARGLHYVVRELVFLTVCIAGVYAMMVVDGRLQLWSYFALDFSTHSAVAIVLVVYLAGLRIRDAIMVTISFFLYALLMLYQQYHTALDILSTLLFVLPMVLLLKRWLLPAVSAVDTQNAD